MAASFASWMEGATQQVQIVQATNGQMYIMYQPIQPIQPIQPMQPIQVVSPPEPEQEEEIAVVNVETTRPILRVRPISQLLPQARSSTFPEIASVGRVETTRPILTVRPISQLLPQARSSTFPEIETTTPTPSQLPTTPVQPQPAVTRTSLPANPNALGSRQLIQLSRATRLRTTKTMKNYRDRRRLIYQGNLLANLRDQIPEIAGDERATIVRILERAAQFCAELQSSHRAMEKEQAMLQQNQDKLHKRLYEIQSSSLLKK